MSEAISGVPACRSAHAGYGSSESKRPGRMARAFRLIRGLTGSEVHVATRSRACPTSGIIDLGEWTSSEVHVAHAAAGAAGHRRALLLRQLGDHGLGGDQQAGNARRVLQGVA